jgi:hypothetical protein
LGIPARGVRARVTRAGWIFAAAVAATALPAAPAQAVHSPEGRGMWIWYLNKSSGGDVAAIARQAHAQGVKTLIVKSGDGSHYWRQFSPGLVQALHARGLHVCAWQYVYGANPRDEASTGARAKRNGADCLIIDAEAEYEGRYASARVYVHRLRAMVGSRYRLGLTSFPYVDYHPAFPYSVFLGPGGAQFNLPQMYWQDIGTNVDAVFRHTLAYNRIYRRPILPIGQTDSGPASGEVGRFRALTVRYGLRGVSWWDYAWTSANGLWASIGGPFVAASQVSTPGCPRLGRTSRGDDVVWLQQHLARAFPRQRITGLFANETAHHLRAFQARHHLRPTGRTNPATWRALRRLHPIVVPWGAATTAAHTARAGRQRRTPDAPQSAALRATAYEIPPATARHADP